MKSCVRYTIAVYFGLALAGVLGGPTATGEGRSDRRLLGNQAPQWPIQHIFAHCIRIFLLKRLVCVPSAA